jgi:predicted dehydrogenase
VEDFCVTCITFDNNLAFSLEISWDFPIPHDHFSLEIVGQKGIGTLNPVKLQKIMHGQMMNITPEIKDSKISNFKMGYQNEINHFVDFLTGREDHLESTIDDTLLVYKMIDGIYESIRENQEVQIK